MTRVAVIGAGSMGRNHVRVLRDIPEADLVAVADTDIASAEGVARAAGIKAYSDHRELLDRERPEAVSVVVPTHFHHDVSIDALDGGAHVLVEKPIAFTPQQAEAMMATAARLGKLLMVGHVERYNPAVIEVKRRLAAGELGRTFQMHARRLGPFPQRIRDVGVTVDLATHDIDVMRFLSQSEVVRVSAEASRAIHSSNEDMVNGLIRFESGTLGLLEANWLTPTKIRELLVTGEGGMFRVDYLTQDLYFFENAHEGAQPWESLNVLRGGVVEGGMTRFALAKREPLRAELEQFIAATQGQPAQVASASDGLAALRVALALIASADRHSTIELAAV